mmetsp:Transcript_43463/g.91300  ORF Transcript_43463/g.91300 Transcript_43463/m.91300 type:complete len:452 (-) Transcript_43463:106-1461(-)
MAPFPTTLLHALVASSSFEYASARYLMGNRLLHASHADHRPAEAHVDFDENDEPPEEDEVLPSPEPQSLIAAQFSPDPHVGRDKMEMIRMGELGFVGIRYSPNSFAENDDDSMYSGVYGEFCAFNSQLNKEDPSYYPTMKDVMSQSNHCGEHRYTLPLNDVMDSIKNSKEDTTIVKDLPLTGMLFHQGYSGAGLISNALAAFESTLVFSEHQALHDVLSACDLIHNRYRSDDCSPVKQEQLIRDVISLLSRTTKENVEHLFLKLHSASAVYLPTLRKLYPDAKWTFSYRKAGETLAKAMKGKRSIVCGKTRRNPSSALAVKSSENSLDLEQLSHHELCALHLSTLLEAALLEQERSDTGMLVSYDDIVSSGAGNIIVDMVLPYLGLQEELNSKPQLKDRIEEILSKRTNTHGVGQKEQWDAEGEMNMEISEEVQNAVKIFMGDLMGDSNQR